MNEIIETHIPDVLSVERVFFNHNHTSCLSTAAVMYMCMLAAEQAGIASHAFTPQQVKMACGCGGSASKTAVQSFVSKITGAEINNAHIADSVACAMAGLLRTWARKKPV